MGFSPRDVDQMSIWEFMAAVDAWHKANSVETDSGNLSNRDADEIWEWMQTQTPVPLTRMQ
ncbi:hypothetical protein GOC14_06735 [Sinorhizobium meliloti]|nr:hypothetical protein [Sinorhizobium meliloti]